MFTDGNYLQVRNLRPSKAAYDLIKESEGLKLESYICPAGHPTVGWGHVIPASQHPCKISLAQAERYLREDVEEAVRAIQRLVKVELTQGQFDALTSFVFNFGSSKFGSSTLLNKLNQGDYLGALAEFDRWVGRPNNNGKPLPGLVIRRDKEQDLFDN